MTTAAEPSWMETDTEDAHRFGDEPDLNQAGAPSRRTNVGEGERLVSLAAGSILAALGAARRDLAGLVLAGIGGGLIYRGASGHCPMYSSLGYDTAHAQTQPEEIVKRGTHVSEAFLIGKPREELYAYWRNLENLPTIMSHLRAVRVIDQKRSHWVAEAPRVPGVSPRGQVEWDAEITLDEPNTRIAWRSLPGADVDNTGSVEFTRALGDRGTYVRVVLDYLPPAGAVGRWVAKLLGESPEGQIREDLRRFKRTMEAGEVPTIEGQPRGTCTGQGKREGE